MEINNIIQDFESNYKDKKNEKLIRKKPKQKKLSKEFAYYQSCFTDTLRSGKWKQVPSNTLAKDDIIRLLKGDVAPTFIERIFM